MIKKIKFKTKNTKIAIFLISVILTAIISFWLPMSYYFLPKAADAMKKPAELAQAGFAGV